MAQTSKSAIDFNKRLKKWLWDNIFATNTLGFTLKIN
jgi:hypothetical protein